MIFCHADNLNTDGIYPGKYTYVDDLTTEQMAKVVMENYDPKFADIVSKVIIIIINVFLEYVYHYNSIFFKKKFNRETF